MSTRIIAPMLPDEQLLALDPPLQQQIDDLGWWQRRLRMFTGRALGETALTSEQDYRSGHLARAGELLSPGIVNGLVLTTDASGTKLLVSPGQGIAASGEDVSVPVPVTFNMDDVSVFGTAAPLSTGTGPSDLVSTKFGDWKKSGVVTAPTVGVIVLQPITFVIAGKAADASSETLDITQELLLSPDRDPDAYAFEDWQVLDACRPVFYPWPTNDPSLAIPAASNLAGNILVQEIYSKEAGFGRDETLPWLGAGVPLGLLSFDNSWKIISVDRNSVARQGGLPRLVFDAPIAKSWQAPNYLEAEACIREYLETGVVALQSHVLADLYKFVPPVGLLPPAALDLAHATDLSKFSGANAVNIKQGTTFQFKNAYFPAKYTITATPILLEEVDSFVADSAELAPFDLTVQDAVEMLVPVPAAAYDANLLSLEYVASDFQAQVSGATDARVSALQHTGDLETKANLFLKFLALPPIPVDTDPNNPNISTDEKADLASTKIKYTAPATEAFGTLVNTTTNALESIDIDALKAAAAALTVTVGTTATPLISGNALKIIDNQGLQAFIDALQACINRANDILDYGFARSQIDIYRYRQLVLDSGAATRLATSPVLAQIAQGTVASATTDQLNQFLQSAAAAKQPAPSNPSWSKPSITNLGHTFVNAGGASGTGGAGGLAGGLGNIAFRSSAFSNLISASATGPSIAAQPLVATRPVASGSVIAGRVPIRRMAVQPMVSRATSVQAASTIGASSAFAGGVSNTSGGSPSDVQGQAPLLGAQYDLRTMSIVERLAEPLSQEAAFFTGQNRGEVTAAILALGNPTPVPPLLISLVVDDLPVDLNDGSTKTLGDIRSKAVSMSQVQTVPIPADADEAGIFSAGVIALEQHTRLMRALEGRIAQYTQFLNQAQQALTALQNNLTQIDAALKNAEDALDNARHQYTFVMALFKDELERVNAVNQRRANVLGQVQFLVYRRPLTLVPTVEEPSRELLPLVSTSAVPACLNRSAPTPPELRQMVNLLRNAPANWISAFGNVLTNFERPDLLLGLAGRMQLSAQLAAQFPAPSSITVDSSAYADRINYAYSTHRTVLESYRVQRAAFPVASLQSQAWSSQLASLAPVITSGDLLASEFGNLVTRPIARKLDEITSVAACFYDRVGAVTPDLRLAWAEMLYQESDTADLHDLSALPRWGEVPFIQRIESQQLVSWLFAQINQNVPQALHFLNDLVRVAILVASYAPVSEIIQGEVLEDRPLNIGVLLRVSLPSPRIYQSMPVVLHQSGQIIAHGMVNDLSTSDTAVQVTSVVQGAPNTASAGTAVQFVAQQTWTSSVSHGQMLSSTMVRL